MKEQLISYAQMYETKESEIESIGDKNTIIEKKEDKKILRKKKWRNDTLRQDCLCKLS